MSQYEPDQDPYQPAYGEPGGLFQDQQEPPRQKSKLLLGVLIGCGGMLLLCCGGVVGMGFFFQHWATQAFEHNPAVIREKTAAIAEIDVPESFEPRMAIHFSFPFVGELANLAVYGNDDQETVLILADVSDQITQGQSAGSWAENMRASTNNGQTQGRVEFDNAETETVTRTIRGEDVTFTIKTGRQSGSDKQIIFATGDFPGRLGQGFFMISGDSETLTVEKVKKVIESIE